MKLGLIDLITVIIGIVQICNQEIFIPTIMHDEVTLCGEAHPCVYFCLNGKDGEQGMIQGTTTPGEPILGGQEKNKVN